MLLHTEKEHLLNNGQRLAKSQLHVIEMSRGHMEMNGYVRMRLEQIII
jgi:hypothetical protein